MDISPKQVEEIQEIEKQVSPEDSGPKVLSETTEKDRSVLTNLLAALGITIGASLAVFVLFMVPFHKKQITPPQQQVTTGTLTIAQPNITVTTEYVNPFSQTAQYSNPFVSSQNPFANLTQ